MNEPREMVNVTDLEMTVASFGGVHCDGLCLHSISSWLKTKAWNHVRNRYIPYMKPIPTVSLRNLWVTDVGISVVTSATSGTPTVAETDIPTAMEDSSVNHRISHTSMVQAQRAYIQVTDVCCVKRHPCVVDNCVFPSLPTSSPPVICFCVRQLGFPVVFGN